MSLCCCAGSRGGSHPRSRDPWAVSVWSDLRLGFAIGRRSRVLARWNEFKRGRWKRRDGCSGYSTTGCATCCNTAWRPERSEPRKSALGGTAHSAQKCAERGSASAQGAPERPGGGGRGRQDFRSARIRVAPDCGSTANDARVNLLREKLHQPIGETHSRVRLGFVPSTSEALPQTNEPVSTKRARAPAAAPRQAGMTTWTANSDAHRMAGPGRPKLDSNETSSGR